MSKTNDWFDRNKKTLIVGVIIWFIGLIFLAAPIAVSIVEASTNGVFNIAKFFEILFPKVTSMNAITQVFSAGAIGYFLKTTLYYTIILTIAISIGVYKARNKSEYTNIEHGSSDWASGGEQYRVLSKNKGLILAENNYLPLDKIGNVNVRIVDG